MLHYRNTRAPRALRIMTANELDAAVRASSHIRHGRGTREERS